MHQWFDSQLDQKILDGLCSQDLDSKTYTEVETQEKETFVSTPYMTELIYEYTEDEQTLELFQMPQLSSGRYIHDFEVIF